MNDANGNLISKLVKTTSALMDLPVSYSFSIFSCAKMRKYNVF